MPRSREHQRNVKTLAISSALDGFRWNTVSTIWQPFVLSLGAAMSLLGLLQSAQSLLSVTLRPIGGYLSDLKGRKIMIIAGSFISAAATSIYLLASLREALLLIFLGTFMAALSVIRGPAWDSLLAESSEGSLGSAYGTTLSPMAASGVVGSVTAGIIAGELGYPTVFLICVVVAFIELALYALLVETWKVSGDQTPRILSSLKSVLHIKPELRGFYVAMITDRIAWGISSSILLGMLHKTFGISKVQIGLLNAICNLTWAAAGVPISREMDRRGYKPFLMLSQLIGVGMLLGFLLTSNSLMFALLFVLYGLAIATWAPAEPSYLFERVSGEERGKAIGQLRSICDMAWLPGPFVGGLLYDRFGFSAPILVSLVFMSIDILLLWLLLEGARISQGIMGTSDLPR